jgi:hypothetical protein
VIFHSSCKNGNRHLGFFLCLSFFFLCMKSQLGQHVFISFPLCKCSSCAGVGIVSVVEVTARKLPLYFLWYVSAGSFNSAPLPLGCASAHPLRPASKVAVLHRARLVECGSLCCGKRFQGCCLQPPAFPS